MASRTLCALLVVLLVAGARGDTNDAKGGGKLRCRPIRGVVARAAHLRPRALLRRRGRAVAASGGTSTELAAGKAALEPSPVSLGWPIFAAWAYFLSVSVTAPAMPAFVNSMVNEDRSTRVTPEGIALKGSLESVDQLMTFFFEPVWGAVSDCVGRKPLQVLACAGVAIGWGTVAASQSLPMLIAGRALDGVTSCMLPICQSAVKDLSTPDRLSANLGTLQGLALGAAFIVGGIAGGVMTKRLQPQEVFAVASSIALVAGLVLSAFAPETLPPARRQARVDWAQANTPAALGRLCRTKASAGATLALLLFWTGLNGLQVNLFNYANVRHGWAAGKVVGLTAASGICLAASNALGPRLLAPLIGDAGIVRCGMVVFAAALVGMGASPTPGAFAASVLVGSLATMCLPPLVSIVAKNAGPNQVGAALTALDSASTLDRLVAYKLMSNIFAAGLESGRPGLHFYVGAAFVVVGWLAFEGLAKGSM